MKVFKPHFINQWIIRSLFLSCFLFLSSFAVTSFATESMSDDACVYGLCDNAGEIGNDQTIVRGTSPAKLVETKKPRCEPGELEYLWMYYSASSGGWKEIPNTKSKTYQPNALFRTTYFLRCIRKKGCPTYVESNIIRIMVVDCMPSGIEYEEPCLDEPVKFSAKTVYSTNQVTYRWTFQGGSPSSSTSQHVIVKWSSTGLKKVTLQVIDGNCENKYEEDIYVINCDCKDFYCKVTSSNNCGSGNARANGYGGKEPYFYRWSTGATSQRVTGLAPGDYSVTVMDANGCECVRHISIGGKSDVGCNAYVKKDNRRCGASQGVAVAQGTGGSGRYFYRWSNGQVGPIAFGLPAGIVNVTVTDVVSGCASVCDVKVKEPSISCSTSAEPTTCGENNGIARANGQSGSGSYRYRWSNGSSGGVITNLAPGVYEVTVTDRQTGCTSVCIAEVVEDNSPVDVTIRLEDCSDLTGPITTAVVCTREVTAIPSGGSCAGAYIYEWSNGATTPSTIGNCGSTLSVTVTCGTCAAEESIAIPAKLRADLEITRFANCQGTDGELKATISGGTPPYTYEWFLSGGSGTTNGTMVTTTGGVDAGTYSFAVEDADKCTALGIITLPFDPDCGPDRTMDENNMDHQSNIKSTSMKSTHPSKDQGTSLIDPLNDKRINRSRPVAKLFPNPFHESVNIVLEDYSAFAKSLNIEVLSITGQVIQRQVVDAGAATHKLNIGDHANGIYMVRITGEGILPEIHKVVKN